MKKTFTTKLLATLSCLCIAFGLAGCKKECEHTYDNACDTTCNECGELREITHTGGTATCVAKAECAVCGVEYGTVDPDNHIDENTDHICDRECGKTDVGTHADADKDHACDYGCEAAIGTHSDSENDDDHLCDYGCGATLEEHQGGTATCIAKAECEICGVAYGSVDPDNHDLSTIDESGKCGCERQAPISVTNGTDTYYAFDADDLYTVTTAMIEDGVKSFTFDLPANATSDMLTAICDAFNNTDGVEDGSIDLTLGGVTEIGASAFDECSAFGSVTLLDSVTAIYNYAFFGCSSLTSMTIPASVETIDTYAFGLCEKLTSVTFKEDSRLKTIGTYAFGFCYSLKSVTIPDSVTTIGNSAFNTCYDLASVTIPDSVTTIGDYAFSACYSLGSLTIPDSVTTIGVNAFDACYDLASVYYCGTDASVWATLSANAGIPDTATVYIYSSNMPTAEGNYWYYDTNGAIAFWKEVAMGSVVLTLNEDGESYFVKGLAPDFEGTEVYIPAICNGKPVTEIGERAFYEQKAFTNVTIPNSITEIGEYAFHGCSALTSITIPDSVTEIGEFAFYNCVELWKVRFGENIKLTTIGNYMFSGCIYLMNITIPDSVTSIGEYAFNGCISLTSVTIPDSVTVIGNSAFYSAGFTSVTIPDSVTVIGNSAFNSSFLESVRIPDSVLTIGENAFKDCEFLVSVTFGENSKLTTLGTSAFEYSALTSITIPDSVTKLGNMAFYNCAALKSVYFGENIKLTSIGNYTFGDCISLTSITIPESVETIGTAAFVGTALTSVMIPDSVKMIDVAAFLGCDFLTSIYYDGPKSDWDNNVSKGGGAIPNNAKVYCWSEGLSFELNEDGKSYSITDLNDCTDTDLFIPATYGDDNLPVTAIGEMAFYNYTSLTNVTFCAHSQLETIGFQAFRNCTALESVTIPATVTEIGAQAFRSCKSLKSVTIPDSVVTIGEDAFFYCTALENVTIPATVTEIGDGTFCDCSSLKSVTIPATVTKIYANAFLRCSSLTSVTFGENSRLTTIGDCAFSCTALKSVTIPATVTEIGEEAFSECISLTSVTFGEGSQLETIDTVAFFGCTALTSIYYNGTKSDWDNNVSVGEDAIPEKATVYFWSEGLEFEEIKGENGEVVGYSVIGIGTCTDTVLLIPATHEGKPVTAIGDYAFSKYIGSTSKENPACAALTRVMIPASVTSIGNFAFYSCTALTSVTIPDSVETIGEYVFKNCEALESVTFGENSRLTTIGRQVFNWCKSLTSVTLPDSVTSIGLSAFDGSAVTSIYYEGTESAWAEVEVNDYAIPDTATVYYYSEEKPEDEGNYWHYVGGVPTTKWDD